MSPPPGTCSCPNLPWLLRPQAPSPLPEVWPDQALRLPEGLAGSGGPCPVPVCRPLKARRSAERLVPAGMGRQAACHLSRSLTGDILFSQPGTQSGVGGVAGQQGGLRVPSVPRIAGQERVAWPGRAGEGSPPTSTARAGEAPPARPLCTCLPVVHVRPRTPFLLGQPGACQCPQGGPGGGAQPDWLKK